MKTCAKCGETKLFTEFSKYAKSRDGLQHYCKSCYKISSSAWQKANPDYAKKASAAWRAAHPDKAKQGKAAYRAANTEKRKAYDAAWHAANPGAKRILNQNRRARQREAGGKITKGLAERLYKLQRGKCACGCKQPLGTDYHLDHIMPISLGGTNTDDNIQLLRAKCNCQKSSKHPVDFMRQRGYLI